MIGRRRTPAGRLPGLLPKVLGWASSSGGSGFTAPFDGQIADVEIFDQALDQDAIKSLGEESAFDWAV